ncbi:MAG: MerR family transcriptional regulator [Candidatus Zixiibacteriota bacterium]
MPFFDRDIREKFHNLSGTVERLGDWEPVISIGTAAAKVGLSVSALRKYEKEGLLIFYRSGAGRRLLSWADIELIKIIQHLISELGLNIEGIRRLLALLPCWKLKPCSDSEKAVCGAARDPMRPCWMVNRSMCRQQGVDCRECHVYRRGAYCTEIMKSLLFDIDER